jgi:Hsp33 protein
VFWNDAGMTGQAASSVFVSRPVSDAARGDVVVPFAVEPLDVRGRVVRLGTSIDQILVKHDYTPPVARLAGEAAGREREEAKPPKSKK